MWTASDGWFQGWGQITRAARCTEEDGPKTLKRFILRAISRSNGKHFPWFVFRMFRGIVCFVFDQFSYYNYFCTSPYVLLLVLLGTSSLAYVCKFVFIGANCIACKVTFCALRLKWFLYFFFPSCTLYLCKSYKIKTFNLRLMFLYSVFFLLKLAT